MHITKAKIINTGGVMFQVQAQEIFNNPLNHSIANRLTSREIAQKRLLLANDNDEKSLWRAVICQALEDALMISKNPRKLSMKRKAIEWLTSGCDDFYAVCSLAEVRPANIQFIVSQMLY